MEVTRNDPQHGVSTSSTQRRTLSDATAQALAAVITIITFSGLAAALAVLFERMGGG